MKKRLIATFLLGLVGLFPTLLFGATISWIGGSGDWNTAVNWSGGALPGTNDDVVIGSGPDITVTHSADTHVVKSILSQQAFVLSGGSLTVSNTVQVNNTFTLSGGTMVRGTVLQNTNGQRITVRSGTFDGVTVNRDLEVSSVNGAILTVTNGLVLNGTVQVGNPTNLWYGQILFEGSQTLSGNGTVVFGGNNGGYLYQGNTETTLTLGPGITIRGQTGFIGNGNSVINQGTISADVSGGTITVNAQQFNNAGTMQGLNGGSLSINGNWRNSGVLTANDSTLTLHGSWTNAGTINFTNTTLNLGGGFTLATLGLLNRSGGTVNLTGTLTNTTLALSAASGSWVLNGGTVLGGTINTTNGAALIINRGTFDGVTVNGDWDVGSRMFASSLTVLNGLVLNGTVQVGNPTNFTSGFVYFKGTQTLSGNGTVVFGNQGGTCNALLLASGGTTLTIGPGITVRGYHGALGYSFCYNVPGDVSVINQGTISADVSGGTIYVQAQPFVNQGNLGVAVGAYLNVNSSLFFNDPKFLKTQAGATLQVTSNLLGSTRAKDFYSPLGTTVFEGTGKAGSPQLLEVMGQDLGSGPTGFDQNFVYGTLSLANNTYVRLVDQSDNSPGTSAEALYVNVLILPSGSTLDLGGLHLYARGAQIAGSIVSGSISQVADSGPIALAIPTSGAISVPGELDGWTFFGRAQQRVTIAVDTGSGNVLLPRISYAEVQLLDPSMNLLARASDNVAGQVVALTDVTLPADGTYVIHVRAPANQSASTGNYLLTVWNVTPNVASLLLNQQVNGRIETPYSVDEWNFSAAANQQVAFHLVNVSQPGVAFDLKGPNGWIGFSNLIADSVLVTLPYSGGYTLTAHGTGGAYDFAYAFQLVQTAQTNLALGTTFTGYFAGNGQPQLFTITVTNGGPLRILLNNAGFNNATELYAQLGSPPTRGSFDFSSVLPNSANQQILIPYSVPGTYYVLVYGNLISTPGNYTVGASSTSVLLTGITPVRSANNVAFNMTLTGAGFGAGTTVELAAGGSTPYAAASVSVDSFTQLTASFPPNLAPAGTYSVRVSRPSGGSGTLTNGFTLTAAGVPRLETRLLMPGWLGRRAVATIYLEYANTGDAAMPAPLLILKSADDDDSDKPILTLDHSRIVQNFWSAGQPPGTANEIFLLASGAQPGVLNPGERFQVPVYYLGLQAQAVSDGIVEMEIRFWTGDDPTPIDWDARKEALRPPTLESNTWDMVYNNLTSGLTNSGAYVRMLDDNAQFLGRLGEQVLDVGKLWNFEVQQAYGYSAISVLDSAVDTSTPTPGVTLDFARHFSSNLRARNNTGLFGRGWYTPWQAMLIVENGGDLVKLIGEAGSARLFARDTRNGGYFSGAGDSATLTAVGGAGVYELRDSDGTVTRFRADGKIDYVQDPNGNRVTAGYNGLGRLATLSHTSGASISLGYNGAGLISAVNDSAGRSLAYAYDPTITYLQTVTTGDGKVTTYTYETAGTIAQRHALTSVTRGGTTRHFTYDTRGRIATTYLASGDQLIAFGYDTAGGVAVTDAQGTTYFYFDYRGLLAKVTDALGNTTTAEFNNDLRLSRSVTPTGESRSFAWCDCGSLTSLTDELGHTATFQYDNPFKRLTGFTDTRGNTAIYAYDAEGNLLSTTYPNNSIEQYGNYTAAGLPQRHANRRNQPISYTYTASGQVDHQTFTDSSYADFDFDARGNLLTVTEHPAVGTNKITNYTYDYPTSGDRLRKVTYPDARWVEFFYDVFGRRQRMTDSTGQTNNYEYDAAGRLWKLRDGANSVLAEYLYNASGSLQRINKGNRTYTTYDYDSAGQVLHLVNHAPNGSVNSRFDYTYDSRGRRRTMQTIDGSWSYDYDGTGQLTHAVLVSSNPAIPNQDLQYNYDATGNRTSAVINGATTNYVANNLNQYTSVGGIDYQYDADGNLTLDGVHSYAYDAQSRLVHVTGPEGITEYEYDAFGDRTATVLNGQRTEYLLDPTGLVNVTAEHSGAGALLARNVNGIGLVGRSQGSGELDYLEFDAIGSTAGISSPAGSYLNRYVYDPFGKTLQSNVTVSNPFRFVGQFGVMKEGNGLDFMRARFYDPDGGRFLSQDPLAVSPLGAYIYANNNPASFTDPLGLEPCPDPLFEDAARLAQRDADSIRRFLPNSGGGGSGAGGGSAGGGCPPGGPFGPGGGGGGGGGGGSGGNGGSGTASSLDPNELIGPSGYAVQNFVVAGNLFGYQIFFENEINATAPAQFVQIANPLSTNLDWQTFELTEIAFGDHTISVPANSQHFQTTIAVSQNGVNFQVQIEAGIQLATGNVFANFSSINPRTSLPPSVDIGFLPPEDGTGRGMGHVSYLIHPRPSLPTGTQIRNVAYITFDVNPVISTDQVDPHDPSKGTDPAKQALITIDANAPSSAVAGLPATVNTISFHVTWSGTDSGAGIAGYDILVSTNSGPWGVWRGDTTNTLGIFTGQDGNTYAFYSIARDYVGQVEPVASAPDATTRIELPLPPADVTVSRTPSPSGQDVLIILSYPTIAGRTYTVAFRDDLTTNTSWQPLPGAPHNSGSVTETNLSNQRYYRLQISP